MSTLAVSATRRPAALLATNEHCGIAFEPVEAAVEIRLTGVRRKRATTACTCGRHTVVAVRPELEPPPPEATEFPHPPASRQAPSANSASARILNCCADEPRRRQSLGRTSAGAATAEVVAMRGLVIVLRMTGRLSLTEFPADDPDRARRFWSELLGVSFAVRAEGRGEGWETGDQAPALGVHLRGRGPGDSFSLPYFAVDDLEKALEQVRALGGSVVHPGAQWAICKDSEGSPFGLARAAAGADAADD